MGHIIELLENFDAFFALAAKPQLVATAIFWHDVVYIQGCSTLFIESVEQHGRGILSDG